ncbi:aspartate kinase [Cytobacillus firmus]|uniref:aspartate kinase n=1 Tax=Cytobacillus oceanisediminis TaxID=665099 RepID=UPI001D155BC8|nr:aspartate kinase [Cytobacillus oceanisediminis]MCC3649531.1 aspartate kinase [Cytobacillus oceanisediminis]
MKVVKFGGSSLASGKQIEKVFNIINADPERKIIVVSAPGKRFSEDDKVTDLLIACAEKRIQGEEADDLAEAVLDRYGQIADELELGQEIKDIIRDDLFTRLSSDTHNPEVFMDLIKASGEDNNAKLVAAYFQQQGIEARYVSPKEAGLLVSPEPGNAQVLPEAYDKLLALREQDGIIIFPGFFGYSRDGQVFTFSRSGSDVTGSILAGAAKADLYENFTDVDAVYSVNPFIVESPKEIKELTYREMRELSYAGFTVLHDEALVPAFRAGIPVQIKNTNNPSAPGTRIVNERDNTNGPVIGIASDQGFCSIYVGKYLMNREVGFGRRLLTIFEENGLSYEHTPSGIDDISIILRENQFTDGMEEEILNRIQHELHADEVKIQHSLSLIMVVGEGMRQNIGTMARASKALAKAKVNMEMINQGSSEVSMMFGVQAADEVRAVQALYNEFFAAVAVV